LKKLLNIKIQNRATAIYKIFVKI